MTFTWLLGDWIPNLAGTYAPLADPEIRGLVLGNVTEAVGSTSMVGAGSAGAVVAGSELSDEIQDFWKKLNTIVAVVLVLLLLGAAVFIFIKLKKSS